MELVTIGRRAVWIGFTGPVRALIALDRGAFRRGAHPEGAAYA